MSAPVTSVPSLGKRLSITLAVQSFVALALVSAAVYAVTASNLDFRQASELREKREVVQRALAEYSPEANIADVKLMLDHFIAGHADISLSLESAPGQAIYTSRVGRVGSSVRQVAFQMPWKLSPTGQVQGEFVLNISADEQLLRWLAVTLVAAVVIGATAVSISGFWLVRRGLAPVRGLSRQLQAMTPDKSGLRLDGATQPVELQPLVAQFNLLLGRVERAYAQLEGFNADVAHELRTPLTTLIGASEVGLHRPRSVPELQEIIGSNLEELQRLSAIVNDMLFLSRANRGAHARRASVASLAALIGEVIEYHDASVQDANVQTRVEGDAAGVFDAPLLRRAMSNLLGNATRYANKQSTILVAITPIAGTRVRLSVSNQGPTIDDQHMPRLFDRFYRAEAARQHSGVNHGLGLAIVAAIARMHGGEPFAVSENGRTTVGIEIESASA